jgi:carbamoyltransferase
MSTILGINISHSTSICQITDGKIDFYYDEGRVRRVKKVYLEIDSKPELECIKKYVDTNKLDNVIFASYGSIKTNKIDKDKFLILKNFKILNKEKVVFYKKHHHIYHAFCGFYFSGFNEAIVVVMDGGGAIPLDQYPSYREIESVYYLNKFTHTKLYSHLSNQTKIASQSSSLVLNDVEYEISLKKSSGTKFSELTSKLNLGFGNDSGKTMGLAAYGNLEGNRPQDLARQLQEETKKHTIKLIKKAVSYNDCKNIILSGGYALNCTNNYEYLKEFPNHNFFIDPISHDGGTALGAALYLDRMLKN